VITVLLYAAYSVGLTYTLWVFYLACMHLEERKEQGKLTPRATFFGWPTVWIGYAVDFLCNVTVMTVLFVELPRETTVTERLKRHAETDASGWRKDLACWFKPVLNPFDPAGDHI